MIVLHFFVTTLLVYVLLIQVVGHLFGWKHEELKWNALAATLANVGYFGLAVIRYAVGEHAVSYAVAVSLAFNLYMAFFGFAQVGGEREWSGKFRRVLQNPYLYAIIAGLLWKGLDLTMPDALDAFLNLAASATLPLTLLLTGAEMRKNRYGKEGLWDAAKVSIVKLVLPVVVAWPLAVWMTDDKVEQSVMILMFGMPTSLNLLLPAKDQERDTTSLAMIILLTTIASPFTLMFVMNHLP